MFVSIVFPMTRFELENFINWFLVQVFVGLGQPYEGPAALEALANGCFFLNPKVWSLVL